MSIHMSRLFPKSNSSLSLCKGAAIKSLVLRLREDTFVLDTGDAVMKERAASKFNDMVGSSDVVKAVEPHILLPRRFRHKLAWSQLTQIWRRNGSIKGFILDKVRGLCCRLSFIMLLLSHDKFVSSARNNSAIILSNTKTKVIHGSYLYMVPTLAVLSR
ncbi:hypothetical protein Leryth_024775 [Lithospermum erythrorhizon]|nr:hypothetical protein Leryth_024775 [Lithospermum erythrorhizon]